MRGVPTSEEVRLELVRLLEFGRTPMEIVRVLDVMDYELGLVPVFTARRDPALSEECRRLRVRLN